MPEQALSGVEYLILPIAQADRVPREWRGKTLLELPRVMFGKLEEDTARRVAATQDAGFAGYEVSNIAHLRLCRGLPMSGGFGLNVTNQVAAQFYADNGLGSVLILPETKDSDISTIAPTHAGKPVPTGVLVYGHMPLMVTRACPLQNIHDCAHCDKTGVLTDRKARKLPVRCGRGRAYHLQPGAHLYGRQARCPDGGLRRGLLHAGKQGRGCCHSGQYPCPCTL